MSLATGDKHGHALMKDVEQFAGVRLGPGTLYKALGRLEADGLIVPLPPEDRRRPYAMTPHGHEALSVALDQLGRIVGEGRRRLRTTKSVPRIAGAR